MTTTFHIDRGKILRHEFTDEGYLRCFARVARSGELRYSNEDGLERIETVSESVLFDEQSIDSFKGKAITDDHPPVPLTLDNTAQYLKGLSSNLAIKERSADASFLGLAITITDPKLINDVTSGRKDQISCGYWAETRQRKDGKFEQIKRRGNHLAVVKEGRAGENVRIVMDSADNTVEVWTSESFYIDSAIDAQLTKKLGTQVELDTLKVDTNMKKLFMKQFTLDALPFETEDMELVKQSLSVNSELQTLRSDNKEINSKLQSALAEVETLKNDAKKMSGSCDALNAEKDSLQSQLDAVNEKLKALQETEATESMDKIDAADVSKEIELRLAQWDAVLPTLKADNADYVPNYSKSVTEIRREYLAKRYPTLSLDSKDEAYINGAYEAAINTVIVPKADSVETQETAKKVDEVLIGIGETRADAAQTTDPVRVAFDSYLKTFETAYQSKN